MFKIEKTHGSPNSFVRSRVNEYRVFHPSSSLDAVGYVPVQRYAISESKNELITDGLNACTALGFEAQGKVFLAHFTRNVEDRVPEIIQSIKKEFNVISLQRLPIKLKVLLGSYPEETNSLDTIFVLLHRLKLLDRFIHQVQGYVRTHLDKMVTNTSVAKGEFYQFLEIKTVKNESSAKKIAKFIHKIKSELVNCPDAVLEKTDINDNVFASTCHLVNLPLKRLSSELNGKSVESSYLKNKYSVASTLQPFGFFTGPLGYIDYKCQETKQAQR